MSDRSVLVTGASSGIGRETARAFRSAEWSVFAGARDPADLDALEAAGCELLELDVTDPADCEAAVDRVIDAHGTIDCLVNAAGYAQWGPMEDVSAERLRSQFEVNCVGPHRLSRLALPSLRNTGGTIVNVSSVMGSFSAPGYGPYSASKQALEAITDAMRAEVAPFDVDVVIVAPGPVNTEFRTRAMAELAALDRTAAYEVVYRYFEDRETTASIGASNPEAVADAILCAALASDPAERVTVGRVASAGALAGHLPPSIRDFAFSILRRVVS